MKNNLIALLAQAYPGVNSQLPQDTITELLVRQVFMRFPPRWSGSPELRKALFLAMGCLIQTKPQNAPVYQLMDKKRAENKPYLVYRRRAQTSSCVFTTAG